MKEREKAWREREAERERRRESGGERAASCRLTRRVLLITFLLSAATGHTSRLGTVAKDTLSLQRDLNRARRTLRDIGWGRGWRHGAVVSSIAGVVRALRISLEGISQVSV